MSKSNKICPEIFAKLTIALANALSYSADSNAAERKSSTGILPFSVNVANWDFICIDLEIVIWLHSFSNLVLTQWDLKIIRFNASINISYNIIRTCEYQNR